jgi:hypothetical protein
MASDALESASRSESPAAEPGRLAGQRRAVPQAAAATARVGWRSPPGAGASRGRLHEPPPPRCASQGRLGAPRSRPRLLAVTARVAR